MTNLAYTINHLEPVDISNTSTLGELLDNIFLSCSNRVLNSHYLLENHYDAENLHHLRVSLRRFNSFINFFKYEISNNERIVAKNLIEKLLKPTSRVRDFDVINENYLLPSYNKNPGENEFRRLENHSKKELTKLHEKTLEDLTSSSYLELLEDLQDWAENKKWRNELSTAQKKTLKKSPAKLVNKKLKKHHKKIINSKKDILIFSQKELHRLRIDIKELRYVTDDLGFFIKDKKSELELLKNLQDILGKINDTYVAQTFINNLGKTLEIGITRSYIEDQAEKSRNQYLLELENFK